MQKLMKRMPGVGGRMKPGGGKGRKGKKGKGGGRTTPKGTGPVMPKQPFTLPGLPPGGGSGLN
jgi:hypothetical protein